MGWKSLARFWPVPCVALALAIPGRGRKVDFVVERDGLRTSRVVYLSFFAHDKVERDGRIRVSDELRGEFARRGLRLHPSHERGLVQAERIVDHGRTTYSVRLDERADPKAVADFYAAQLASPRRWKSPGFAQVTGAFRDGSLLNAYVSTRGGGKNVLHVQFCARASSLTESGSKLPHSQRLSKG